MVSSLLAQEPTNSAENPLSRLKSELERVVSEANFPITPEQENAITLMMEDRRKASEDLFGNLMDFRSGPTRGQESDQLNSAIQWMQNEFQTRLKDYLSAEQWSIWSRHLETAAEIGRAHV